MSTTVKEQFDKEIAKHEYRASQLRGKRARLNRQHPELMDLEIPGCWIHSYGRFVQICINDTNHIDKALPTKLATLLDHQMTDKILKQTSEQMNFDVDNEVTITLHRSPPINRECHKAIVQMETSFCGDVPDGMEVIEYLDNA